MTQLIDLVESGKPVTATTLQESPGVLEELERFIRYVRLRPAGDHGEVAFVLHRLSGRTLDEIGQSFDDRAAHLTRDRLIGVRDVLRRLSLTGPARPTPPSIAR